MNNVTPTSPDNMKNLGAFTHQSLLDNSFTDRSVHISVQSMGRTIFLTPDMITFLEGEGNYTYINTNSGKRYLVSKTLKSLAELLESNFIRMEDDRMLRMSCGKEVIVSRRKIKEITSILDHTNLRISA
jgi:two-component system LytT family response regulator